MPSARINLSTTPEFSSSDNPWPTGFLHPVCTLRCDGRTRRATAHIGHSLLRQWDDPLIALDWMSKTGRSEVQG